MPAIFVSYRRNDTRGVIGRLYDRLTTRFGKDAVFVDVDAIPAGVDFRSHIAKVLKDCDVMLAVVSSNWTGPRSSGPARIFDPDDWVRAELEVALAREIPIIPVLVDRIAMPRSDELPDNLKQFAYLQSCPLDSEADFNTHARRVLRQVERYVGWQLKIRARRPWLLGAAAVVILAPAIGYLGYRASRPLESRTAEDPRAIAACNSTLALGCAQQGGVFGSAGALAELRACKDSAIFASDDPSLHWKDVWTTSVYSFAAGGGGPGGGLDNDELKIGGWGDWYFSLIRFDLPRLRLRPVFGSIALYSKRNDAASVALDVDRIIQRWDFPKGDRLWWKDRPGARAITTESLPAPRQEEWYVIDLTRLVQEWFDGAATNNGIQIRPASNVGSLVVFVSSDAADKALIPRLVFCM